MEANSINPDHTAPLKANNMNADQTAPKANSMNPDQTAPKANNMNPDQTAPLGSSLIWVHIVCNIGYHSLQADERVDDNCWNDGKKV